MKEKGGAAFEDNNTKRSMTNLKMIKRKPKQQEQRNRKKGEQGVIFYFKENILQMNLFRYALILPVGIFLNANAFIIVYKNILNSK